MKKELRWSALKSGMVISLCLIILFVLVLYAGTLRHLFVPTVEVSAHFQGVKGLARGAPVWLFGIQVGSVKKIHLDPEYGLIVTFFIERDAMRFLKADTEATVLTMGLLGDTYVELTPGSADSPPFQPGEILKGTTPLGYTGVVKQSEKAVEKMTDLISKVEILTLKIAEGEGSLSRLINDPSLYDNLVKLTVSLQLTLEKIEKSRGTLKLLIEEPTLYNKLVAVASSMKQWSEALNNSSGTLTRLINDSSLYENLNESAQNLDAILLSINRGQGVAGALIRDEELVHEVKADLLEMRRLAEKTKILLEDLKEHPDKYFKFSLF